MALTDIAVRNAKPGPKIIRLADARGLSLEISPSGGKRWRFRYRFDGKANMLSLGVYPDVSLKEARERREEARRILAQGIDPAKARQEQRAETLTASTTFEHIAREWFAKFQPSWSEKHASKILRRFEKDVFPWLGHRPIKDISAPELLAVIRRMESRGAMDMARGALRNCGQVFRYAVATGRGERDPSSDLRGALPPAKVTHHPSLTDPKDIAALLRAIDAYTGAFVTQCALRLAPLVFLRPGELRNGEWSEIDFDAAEWRIPSAKMKMREQHIVPLSQQAGGILREIHPLTGPEGYIFPGRRGNGRPMSENTINAALRYLGYDKNTMTGHGFRSLASTRLHEMGFDTAWIERQLAHGDRNKIRASYNFAQHLAERRRMMQVWADYLDQLKAED